MVMVTGTAGKPLLQPTVITINDTERETLVHLCLPTKVICPELGVTQTAWETRVWRLLARFGVENKRALIIKALQLKMVSITDFTYRDYNA